MANIKITELTELLTGIESGDVFPLVDINDLTQASTGTTKKITIDNLNAYLNSNLSFLSVGGNVSDLTNDAGYLTTETDPVFTASPAGGIVAGDITNWNTAFGWGDHATEGYLTTVALDDLTDATITTPADGEALVYNSGTSQWENQVLAIGSGKVGIADASGVYTYYSDLQSANTAASAGDTIELFSDINETGTTVVTLKDGVKYNFNGHTYTNSNAGNNYAFNFGTGTVYLFNGKILRSGAGTSSRALDSFGGGTIIGNNFQVENTNGAAAVFTGGLCRNIDFINAGSGIAVQMNSNGRLEDCKGISTSSIGLYIANGTGVRCYGYSTVSIGLSGGTGEIIDCTGVSIGNDGLQTANVTIGCKGYSEGRYGIAIQSNDKLINCHAYSSANYAYQANQKTPKMYNCTGYSTANYGFNLDTAASGDCIIDNCSFESEASFAGVLVTDNSGVCNISNTSWTTRGATSAITVGGSNQSVFDNNSFELTTAAQYSITGTKSIYYVGCTFSAVSTTAVNATITQLQTNTTDSFGNVQIG